MKKLIAALLIAALLLAGTALAATYESHGICFEYDGEVFEITQEEQYDEGVFAVLSAREPTLEDTFINFSFVTLEDEEALPTPEVFEEIEEKYHTKVEKMDEWLGFKNVYTFAMDDRDEDGDWHAEEFIAPIYSDDALKAVLYVYVCANDLEDEEAGIKLSDAISAVLDSLKVTVE